MSGRKYFTRKKSFKCSIQKEKLQKTKTWNCQEIDLTTQNSDLMTKCRDSVKSGILWQKLVFYDEKLRYLKFYKNMFWFDFSSDL